MASFWSRASHSQRDGLLPHPYPLLGVMVGIVALKSDGTGNIPHMPRQRRVAQQRQNTRRHAVHIMRRHEKTVDTLLDHFVNACRLRRHRQPPPASNSTRGTPS